MNKKLPEYLLKLNTNLEMLAFVAVFSFVFICVYTPFESSNWFNTSSSSRQFLYSAIAILGGVAILSLGRFLLFIISKKATITILQYSFWLCVEILFIAIIYSVFNVLILNDSRGFPQVFRRAILFVPLILFIPYTVSFLYFAFKDRDVKLRALRKETADSVIGSPDSESVQQKPANDVIHFVDEKGALKLSIQSDFVLYVLSADNYVSIYYQNKGKIIHTMVRTTLKSLEEKLEPYGFVRCHRSYLVNVNKVKIVRKEREGFFIDLDMDGIGDIPISKTYAEKMMKVFSFN